MARDGFYKLNSAVVRDAPPPHPAPRELQGRDVTLLPLGDDADTFAELFQRSHGDDIREKVWDYMPYGPFADAEEMRQTYADMAAPGDPQFYAVRHIQDDALAGIVSYLRIAPAAYSIEIGHIWHAPDRQRGRANTEAAYLLMGAAFAAGYRRVEWKCNALNDKSRRAALRLGLAFEGVFRQHVVFGGKNRDTAWFALLDRDWPAARDNFEKWREAPLGQCSLTKLNLPLVEWSLPAHDAWQND